MLHLPGANQPEEKRTVLGSNLKETMGGSREMLSVR